MEETFVYLNGQFLPRAQAQLDLEDRAAMFGDGVYEVTHYFAGKALGMDRHLARLRDSLKGIEIAEPAALADLPAVSDELVRRNGLTDASVYWQISRGAAPRKHLFPPAARPTVLVLAYPAAATDFKAPITKVKAVLRPDVRWERCCFKTLMLLPNVIAKNQATAAGADEAILHRGQRVTEGTSTNVFAVRGGKLQTHPADQWILPGITRGYVLERARELNLPVLEQPMTVDELLGASEVMITGTTTQVAAVTHIEGRPIGRGEPGEIAQALHAAFRRTIRRECLGG